jgi:hypothetical protein
MALVAGCGGDDDSSASLTKAQFVRKGNAICAESEVERIKAMEAAGSKFGPSESPADQQKKLLLASMPSYEKAVSGLDELGAPEGDEKKADAIIEAMEEAVEASKADPEEVLTSGVVPFKKANRLLEDYGLSKCDMIGGGKS